MEQHDQHYRRLFSQPDLLRALITGILPAAWAALLDCDTLEPIPSDHLSEHQHARQGDLLWRVRRRDTRELYLLILLEHQARGDRFMSLRTLSYTALSYETLLRRKLLPPGKTLPAILPIVLYSGTRPWRHPVELSALLDPVPSVLQPYQPQMRYILIDEGELVRAGRLPPDNLASMLFQLEHNLGVEHAARLLQALSRHLRGNAHQELYRAFGLWVRHILLPRAWPKRIPLPDSNDLTEIATMTATLDHSRDWTLKFRLEGREEGLHAGQAALLRCLIERRFGTLPPWAEERMAHADLPLLQQWALNVLDADSIEKVFEQG